MDFTIEDKNNISYISIGLMSLFYEKSMIERTLILENNNENSNGLYLQKLINNNFIQYIRNNLSISYHLLNEIRVCALTLGWKNSNNITECFKFYEPNDFIIFLFRLINFVPYEISSISQNISNYVIKLSCKNDVQSSYNEWNKQNIINNIPICIMFEIKNISDKFNINKNISLFPKTHQYSNLKWAFNSLFYHTKNNEYKTILFKNNTLVSFTPNQFPCLKNVESLNLNNLKNTTIYILYHKTPSI